MNGFMNMGMGYNQPMNIPNDYFSRMNMNMNVNNLPHYDIILAITDVMIIDIIDNK